MTIIVTVRNREDYGYEHNIRQLDKAGELTIPISRHFRQSMGNHYI